MPTVEVIQTNIQDCTIELQSFFGDEQAGVLHMLPEGIKNPEWFKGDILDIYASFSKDREHLRGGHYHRNLSELFFTITGTALWILSDFRINSKTFNKTTTLILGWNKPKEKYGFVSYTFEEEKKLARLRVPAGVYHAYLCLSDQASLTVALGNTGYNKEDYVYPEIIPDIDLIEKKLGFSLTTK
ncbi:hypothetical protein CO172_03785 [Candidatus Uhrbacteria bacterium CG_4_9_14_3_um_filter_36_7]|uniref:dTDP-4-dehydrorhamnose 3,5-epimerase n=1 Tax=Candidatus Uhrbacteria bacterium CG_4_9_14_3_um_filter_36_7 TaxID=1975033 RepID=A0A2M7XES2_9BACT|nr:MAG: hypothetical protein CO172_03785 [Candidatus Uhrbacteria bacterium CG_4_9_14_3_um_filter_36_7]